MNELQKEILTNRFNAWKKAVDNYDNMPKGLPLEKQAQLEYISDSSFWALVDTTSVYLGRDAMNLIAELPDDACSADFIRALQ